MKKLIVTLLKIGISLGIIAYLVWQAVHTRDPDGRHVFDQFLAQPKHWGLLTLAGGLCATAVLLTLVRWWYLVCALELPFRFRDALRIGLLGYLFNLAPMGIVGGDLLKAWMIARHQRKHRAQAVASVVIDRLIGLYMLFIVASAAILLTGFWQVADEQGYILDVCRATFVLTVLGGAFILALLIPGITEGKLTHALGSLPRVGPTVESVIDAVRMYRRKPGVLCVAAVMSVGVHSCFAAGVYLLARGLFAQTHSLSQHFVIMPLGAVTGVLPLPLGPFEFVLDFLYAQVPLNGHAAPLGQGLVVALGYRLICILIAAIGYCYYLSARGEIAQVIREAERQHEAEQKQPPADRQQMSGAMGTPA